MKEDRKFPRASINSAFFLLGEQGSLKGKAKNISPVGVFVRTKRKMGIGDRVHINVHLPRYHGSVVSEAEVVCICRKRAICGETGMGLKWIDLRMSDIFRLDNFVRHGHES